MIRVVCLLAGMLALTGCSNNTAESFKALFETVGPQLLASKAEIRAQQLLTNAAVTADPESLRNFEAPILLIVANDLELVAVIGPLTSRGNESVWYSADEKSIAFRDGMIVGTRGLDGDLQSADVPDIRRQRGEVVRDHFYRDGDEVIRRYRFFCEITDKGPSGAEVLDRIYPARLIEEACEGEGQSFTNAYWIGGGGEIRLSRQWISPLNGQFDVQKVQN